jgi:hypothetical protein
MPVRDIPGKNSLVSKIPALSILKAQQLIVLLSEINIFIFYIQKE